MTQEYLRWRKDTVIKGLGMRRIVILSGARQCGKTTLAKQVLENIKKDAIYRSLDDETLLKSAISDPLNFVKHQKGTMIIDEIQKAINLLPAIKMIVDNNNAKGQFLLTGSADIQSLPEVSESLAGRVKNIRLRPFTQGEMLRKEPTFLQTCFKENFASQIIGDDKKTLIDKAFIGGYPEIIHESQTYIKEWHTNYTHRIFEQDFKSIFNINRIDTIASLFVLLNNLSGKIIDFLNISSTMAISRQMLHGYVNALKMLYLFEDVNPWLKTDYERVAKKPKTYATDTGMMASSLNWTKEEVLLDPDKSGKLIETFVFNELSAQVDLDGDYSLYHYRDREKREIDFMVEDGKGNMLAIEVKAGASVGSDDFKHIRWFKENMAPKKTVIGIILYSGENTVSFGKHLHALPIPQLWQ
jgi:predicted AAA+ superfamily ATPase